ncbi:LysR family transcriptional regulator [Gluconacetobacter entanii]|uniref:LysR family transcriptional regulator n=1 Tax=Gluconacetobacter entanii TaxID=108528 RepID=UPI001C9335E6|nr:LysR family transcriptional regulator [Gluconacetobacter entanii]MBY4640515.1 LysR family transcriptional regulator [Gluconacetobacter entanii]MCW4579114.1 LysR family transcriptional regulator [Gluconacetobacter entanii]MCW4582513.1 LysR family transcriptional regulator [Gluconacetobacter entanii]MCW4585888.1 LysR family transcriptional regulator [Gluconacetobacter entanii]
MPPRNSKVSWQYVDYVLAASESRSFRQVALMRGVKESTISRGIRSFEREIGFALFERTRTGIVLTEAARYYLPEIRNALRHLDQASATSQLVAAGKKGRLRLAISEDAMTFVLAQVLTEHRVRFPNVNVSLVEMAHSNQIYALQSGIADLGLMLQPSEDKRFFSDPLWEEPCMVALPETHILTSKSNLQATDFIGHHVISGQPDCGFQYGRLVVDQLKNIGVMLRIVAEVEHIQTALMMVQAGIGMAFVPTDLSACLGTGVIFRRVHFLPKHLVIWAAWMTDDPSGLVTQFLRTARSIVSNKLEKRA